MGCSIIGIYSNTVKGTFLNLSEDCPCVWHCLMVAELINYLGKLLTVLPCQPILTLLIPDL